MQMSLKELGENRVVSDEIAMVNMKIQGKSFHHPFRLCSMDKNYGILGSHILRFQYASVDHRPNELRY